MSRFQTAFVGHVRLENVWTFTPWAIARRINHDDKSSSGNGLRGIGQGSVSRDAAELDADCRAVSKSFSGGERELLGLTPIIT
jgi:hypothetical protein